MFAVPMSVLCSQATANNDTDFPNVLKHLQGAGASEKDLEHTKNDSAQCKFNQRLTSPYGESCSFYVNQVQVLQARNSQRVISQHRQTDDMPMVFALRGFTPY